MNIQRPPVDDNACCQPTEADSTRPRGREIGPGADAAPVVPFLPGGRLIGPGPPFGDAGRVDGREIGLDGVVAEPTTLGRATSGLVPGTTLGSSN